MRRAALIAIVFSALAPAIALAQQAQDVEPIALDYDVPGTCPSSAWFMSEVQARTSRVRAATSTDRARTLVVRIDATYTGRLSIDENGTRSTPREIKGTTCAEVASALALIAAVAVDPKASTAPRPAPPETPSASASASATPPEPPAPAPTASSSPSSPSPPASSAPEPSPSPPSPSPSRPPDPTFAVGAQAEVAAWSDAVLSFRLFGDLSLGHPTFRLAVARSLSVDRSAAIGSATLAWTTVSAGVCPLRLALAEPLVLRPCAELAGGVLSAEGVGVDQPESRSRPWITAAAHGRLVWALARAFAVELEGGFITPFFRESFFFMPGIPVYEAPVIVGFGRFGVSVRFP